MIDIAEIEDDGPMYCPCCGAAEDEECEPDCDFDDEDSFEDEAQGERP